MDKTEKTKSSTANSALTRRYGSIAEIKREFFPNAAAEEEATAASGADQGAYEDLITELFGPQKEHQHRLPA